jgi:hypothetical protein
LIRSAFVAILVLGFSMKTLAQGTTLAVSPSQLTSMPAYLIGELNKNCGADYFTHLRHLLTSADSARLAADKTNEQASSKELIGLASSCVINREISSSEAARLLAGSDLIVGFEYGLDSTDVGDDAGAAEHADLLGKMVVEIVSLCRSSMITDAHEPGSLARVLVRAELGRMIFVRQSGLDLSDPQSPYRRYLSDLRACAARVHFEGRF